MMKLLFFLGVMYMYYLFCSFHKHLLITLMGLEFFMLSILLYMFMSYLSLGMDLWILIYFMIFMVCDAVLGLILLVVLMRYYGNDLMSNLSLNLW